MLLGVETEYALGGERRKEALMRLIKQVKDTVPSLQGVARRDRFLSNGARFYVDCGGHPEWSTPECLSPTDVVRHSLAGDAVLSDAIRRVREAMASGPRIGLYKCNVDYSGAKTTWGSHESYLHEVSPPVIQEQIISHLVSRVVYTGAGGFNPLSAGIEFALSPRAWHLQHVVSGNSTSDRGIYHTKNESLAKKGYHRLHLLCGESLCSHIAAWLRVGTTALIVRMIEAGLEPGTSMQLKSPLDALQAFVQDPTCQVTAPRKDGHRVSAVEVQRHYLRIAEDNLACEIMPPWAPDVCTAWRSMLDRIENQPESLVSTLDWAIKLAIYRDRIEDRGIRWSSLPDWTHVLDTIRAALRTAPHEGRATVELVLGQLPAPSPIPDTIKELTPYVESHALSWDMMRSVVDLRREMFELDFRFAELGGNGLFDKLDPTGVLDHRAPGVKDIEEAVQRPPAGGRARLRGARVKTYAGRPEFWCNWDGIYDIKGNRTLDLSDPFATRANWKKSPPRERLDRNQLRLMLNMGEIDGP
jgi:hypothetical protein